MASGYNCNTAYYRTKLPLLSDHLRDMILHACQSIMLLLFILLKHRIANIGHEKCMDNVRSSIRPVL